MAPVPLSLRAGRKGTTPNLPCCPRNWMPVPCSPWLNWSRISVSVLAREEPRAMNTQHPPWEQFPLAHRQRLLQVFVEVSLKQLPARQEGSHDPASQGTRVSSRPARLRIRAPVDTAPGALRHRE